MRPLNTLVAAILVGACLVSEGLAISIPGLNRLPSLFSASKDEDSAKDDDHHYTTHKPTRPPLIPAIPHPADHPLHPHNNPQHPLHPDNLPHLPHLPSLPHFTRETIHATKTVFVEVTERVTLHPVCMTVHKHSPPCLPYNPHQGHGLLQRGDEAASASLIQPTAVVQLLEPTRILGGETISEVSTKELEESETPLESSDGDSARSGRYVEFTPPIDSSSDEFEIKDEPTDQDMLSPLESSDVDSARSGRYVEITPPIDSSSDEVEIKDEPTDQGIVSPLNVVHNFIHGSPVKHYKTKTLWVTKVEKVLDTRVTATLLAQNCVPTNSHIPLCAPHGGLFAPGYHGYHGDGVFTETSGGYFVANDFGDKFHGYPIKDDVVHESNDQTSDDTESTQQKKSEEDYTEEDE